MKKENLVIFILAMLLISAMLWTLFFGGEKSRHGVGGYYDNIFVNAAVII